MSIDIGQTPTRQGFSFNALQNVDRGVLIAAYPSGFPDSVKVGLQERSDIRRAELAGVSDGVGSMVTTPGQYCSCKVYNPIDDEMAIAAGEPLFMLVMAPESAPILDLDRSVYAGMYSWSGIEQLMNEWAGGPGNNKPFLIIQVAMIGSSVTIPASAAWTPSDPEIVFSEVTVNGTWIGGILTSDLPAAPVI